MYLLPAPASRDGELGCRRTDQGLKFCISEAWLTDEMSQSLESYPPHYMISLDLISNHDSISITGMTGTF